MEAVKEVQERMLSDDRAFAAFLAALTKRGMANISGRNGAVHESFAAALEVLKSDPKMKAHFGHFYSSRSTGYVEELDRALIRGERAGFVHYGNPTYSRIRVSLSAMEVQHLLSEFQASAGTLEQAAKVFEEELARKVW